MAYNRRDYIITHHLRERFVQRTTKKYLHLQQCRLVECPECYYLQAEARREVADAQEEVDNLIYERLGEAEENRSYMNNSGFLEWYFEKYGYDKRFEFLVDDDLLFVVVYDHGKKVVVTCVDARTHLAGKAQRAKPKFNRVKTKEEKSFETAIA